MIYDCFTFFNETDLLEIRLNELNSIVDKFVIIEGKQTYTGKKKEINFKKLNSITKPFTNKIIYIFVNLTNAPDIRTLPGYIPRDYSEKNPKIWSREVFQRNSIIKGLTNAKPNDIVMISDIDEIPNKKNISQINDKNKIYGFEQDLYYYYLNCVNEKEKWVGTKATFFKNLKSPQELRMSESFELIKNGGWHFSFLGGVEAIKEKIKSFSHQEYNTEEITNLDRIKLNINNGLDIFDRPIQFETTKDDSNLLIHVIKNKTKYKKLFKKEIKFDKNSLFLTNEIVKLRKNINQLKIEHQQLIASLLKTEDELNSIKDSKLFKLWPLYIKLKKKLK